jgi:3-hydroxy-9,10-secoandrosta-1,3,5(10)-triene-9,17-dione monooxygenase reductase component
LSESGEHAVAEPPADPADPAETFLQPDDNRFRSVLGHFITAVDDDEPVGIAANSFTSLSLDPPLILFCVAHSSSTWPRIERAGTFAVNILGEDHAELSQLFAQRGADRFSATPWRTGVSGAPVLEDAIAYLDCRFEAEYPGGDHKIIVGRVLDLDMREGARPLLFYRGGYERMHDG